MTIGSPCAPPTCSTRSRLRSWNRDKRRPVGWTIIGMGFIIWLALVLLFTPRIDYHVTTPIRPDSDEFLHVIQSTCQAAIHFGNKVAIFTNGSQFYPAMRDAIRDAESSIDMEAYIFQPGEVADLLIDA